jgi:hypothetical protein
MNSQKGRLGNERQPPTPTGPTKPDPSTAGPTQPDLTASASAKSESTAGPGWRAVSIVLVGAFMALLDGMCRS